MPFPKFPEQLPPGWTPPAEPEVDEWGAEDVIAGLIRGGAGVIGAPGGWWGAGAGAIGEGMAQAVEAAAGEGRNQGWGQRGARVGTEAALGMIPGNALVKQFRLLSNFLKSGAMSGIGDAARQMTEKGTFDPREVDYGRAGTSGLIGGVAGAGMQKGLEKIFPNVYKATDDAAAAATKAAKSTKTVPVAPPTKTVEGRPVSAGRQMPPARSKDLADDFFSVLEGETGKRLPRDASPKPPRTTFEAPASKAGASVSVKPEDFGSEVSKELNKRLGKVPTNRRDLADLDENIAKVSGEGKARVGRNRREDAAAQKLEEKADREWYESQRATEAKASAADAKDIEDFRKMMGRAFDENKAFDAARNARKGLDKQPATVTVSTSAQPGGGRTERVTQKFTPKSEGADLDVPSVPASAPSPRRSPVDFGPAVAPKPAMPETTRQRQFLEFDDPLASADLWYRTLKDEERAGGQFPRSFQQMIGRALSREKAKAGLPRNQPIQNPIEGPSLPPTKAGVDPVPAPPAAAAGADLDAPLNINSPFYEAAAAAEAQAAGRPFGADADNATIAALRDFLSGQKGAIGNELALALAGATAGGMGGAAWGASQGYNPILTGLAGAGAGFAAPYAPAAWRNLELGAPDFSQMGDQVREAFGSARNISDTIASTAEKVPQLQRANLLMSPESLLANAHVGPWGSSIMAGLELALKGDERGIPLLKSVANPFKFFGQGVKNIPEAERLVAQGELGRAEGLDAGGVIDTAAKAYMGFPATVMTAGDVTARNAQEAVGIPEDLARMYTLTSEPWTGLGRSVANWGRGTPANDMDRVMKAAANTMLPFKRTPANILEQGLERTPLVGPVLQFMKNDGNVGLREVAAQQGLGAAATGAGYLAGDNLDPETARRMKRYVTNFGGVYSLPISMGFTLGQAHNRDRSTKQTVADLTRDALPLPTDQPFRDLGNLLTGSGVPRGALPMFANEIIREANEVPPQEMPSIPTSGQIFTRRGGR